MLSISASHLQRFSSGFFVLLAALLVAAPPTMAHPEGVFLRVDADDLQDQELIEPMPLDDAWIRGATLDFATNISGQAIYDWNERITTNPTIAYRLMGSPSGDLASSWLQERFVDMGYDNAIRQVFMLDCITLSCGTVPAVETQLENVVAVLPGKDLTRWAIIGGHYDTREGTVGALDNTMGASTVLHLAKQFKDYADTNGPFEVSLLFALWDGEEWGLYGSSYFLEHHEPAKVALGLPEDAPVEFVAAMSFDMPGLNWPAQNNWAQYEGGEYAILNLRTSPTLVDQEWRCFSYGCYEDLKGRDNETAIVQGFRNYQTLVHVVAHDWLEYPQEWVRVYDDAYGRSDHVPFIGAGIPGMRIQGSHDEEYPHYHQPTDTLENIAILAGGKDLLLEGVATQARAGGSTLFYIAKTGSIGHYDPEDPWHAENVLTDSLDATPQVLPGASLLATVALMVLGLSWAARRRQ